MDYDGRWKGLMSQSEERTQHLSGYPRSAISHVESDIPYQWLLLPFGMRGTLPEGWDTLSTRLSMGCIQKEAKVGKGRNQGIYLCF